MFKDYENKIMSKTKSETKKIKINMPLRGLKVGDVVSIDTDKDGVPLDRYWRDRVKDSKFDNCVEFLKGSKK